MRKLILATALLGSFASPALAFNCDALQHDPRVCVFNKTKHEVVGISCEGYHWGHTDVSVPEGAIAAHDGAVVRFDSGRCAKILTFHFAGAPDRVFNGFDFENNVRLILKDMEETPAQDK